MKPLDNINGAGIHKFFILSVIFVVIIMKTIFPKEGNAAVFKNPAGIYLLKVNNRNTRTRYEICSKLTIKILERRQWQWKQLRRLGATKGRFPVHDLLKGSFMKYLLVSVCPLKLEKTLVQSDVVIIITIYYLLKSVFLLHDRTSPCFSVKLMLDFRLHPWVLLLRTTNRFHNF